MATRKKQQERKAALSREPVGGPSELRVAGPGRPSAVQWVLLSLAIILEGSWVVALVAMALAE